MKRAFYVLAAAVVVAAVTVVVVVVFAVAGGGSEEPDVVACKDAMRRQFDAATATGAAGTRPEECVGVDDETLERLAGELIAERLEG